jgi:hypothetical protein
LNTIAAPPHTMLPEHARMPLARWIGYFAVFDLLILPYFQLVIIPFSLPLILFAYLLLNTTIKRDDYLKLYAWLVSAVLLSAAASYFIPASREFMVENAKRVVQLFSSFAYFFYFRWLTARTPLRVGPIVVLFLLWFSGLAVAFVLQPAITGEVIRGIYGRLVISEEDLAQHLRYSYIFTDPNTAAYFLLIAGSILVVEKRTFLRTTVLFGTLIPLIFLTQSRGALIALALMIFVTIYPPRRFIAAIVSPRSAIILMLFAGALFAAFVYVKGVAEESDILKIGFSRLFETGDSYTTGGSRFGVWSLFVNEYLPLPWGRGYVMLINGGTQGTHSDLVRLTYSYGLLAVVPAVWFLFSRIGTLAVLIFPALMAFLINSLLDEQKMLALFLSFLAICVGTAERQARLAGMPRS